MLRSKNSYSSLRKAMDDAHRCLVEVRNPSSSNIETIKILKSKSGREILSPELAVKWCIQHHLPLWSKGTWRVYRSGYKAMLIWMLEQKRISQGLYDSLIKEIENAKAPQKKIKKLRRLNFKNDELTKIITTALGQTNSCNESANTTYKWGAALTSWLQASILTGLSPTEWKSAKIIKQQDSSSTLRYKKSTNGNQNKKKVFTTITLSNMTPNARRLIENHVAMLRTHIETGRFDELCKACTGLLLQINKRIWPKRQINITLNTGYHDWSHDYDAVDISSEVYVIISRIIETQRSVALVSEVEPGRGFKEAILQRKTVSDSNANSAKSRSRLPIPKAR